MLEFMDPRILARPAERKKKMFNFHEKGEFEQLANKQRAVAKLERLQVRLLRNLILPSKEAVAEFWTLEAFGVWDRNYIS